jgi:glycerate-2-kinase
MIAAAVRVGFRTEGTTRDAAWIDGAFADGAILSLLFPNGRHHYGTVVVASGADMDGSDGGTAITGGLVSWSTAGRAREQGLSLRKGLVDDVTTALLEACGDAVLTDATLTNVNDLVIIGVS